MAHKHASTNKPIIAVDFDGTIVDHEFPKVGKLKEGAKEALQKLRDLGFHIYIYSCRSCFHNPTGEFEVLQLHERPTYLDMVNFLDDNEIPYDEVDNGRVGKPFATWYIDDRGIHFQDNWSEIANFIEFMTKG